ncbi:MAG: hypothetical protein MJ194_03065 [Clostridia bacterium]|nr:hypothetical protein [Clostridia bacterium]
MTYDELELEKKRKIVKNYWSFAYAKYCAEQQREIDKNLKLTLDNLEEGFANLLKPADKNAARIAKAAEIIKAAVKVHEDIQTIEKERMALREELDKNKSDVSQNRADVIRKGITDYCVKFVTEKDRAAIAKTGCCMLEYLDAMNADPTLAAKVGLTNDQMNLAAKIISMGEVIRAGMQALEEELLDGVHPNPTIAPEQHKKNLAKILAMDLVNDQRLNGNMLKEVQNCKLFNEQANADRFDFAGILSNGENRRAMSVAIIDEMDPPVRLSKGLGL